MYTKLKKINYIFQTFYIPKEFFFLRIYKRTEGKLPSKWTNEFEEMKRELVKLERKPGGREREVNEGDVRKAPRAWRDTSGACKTRGGMCARGSAAEIKLHCFRG